MSLQDRGWYRDAMRERARLERQREEPEPIHYYSERISFGKRILIFLAILIPTMMALVVFDMHGRGLTLSWPGFRRWLSIWLG